MKIEFTNKVLEEFLKKSEVLEELKVEIREQRGRGCEVIHVNSLLAAISWSDSKKGYNYWLSIHDSYKKHRDNLNDSLDNGAGIVTIRKSEYDSLIKDREELNRMKNPLQFSRFSSTKE